MIPTLGVFGIKNTDEHVGSVDHTLDNGNMLFKGPAVRIRGVNEQHMFKALQVWIGADFDSLTFKYICQLSGIVRIDPATAKNNQMVCGRSLMTDSGKVINTCQRIQKGRFSRAAGTHQSDDQLALKPLGNVLDYPNGLNALFFETATRKPLRRTAEFGIQPM